MNHAVASRRGYSEGPCYGRDSLRAGEGDGCSLCFMNVFLENTFNYSHTHRFLKMQTLLPIFKCVCVSHTWRHIPQPNLTLVFVIPWGWSVFAGTEGWMVGPKMLPRRTEKQFTVLTVFIFWSSEDLRRKGENQIYLLRLNFSISGIRNFGVISSHSGVPAPHGPASSKSGGAETWHEWEGGEGGNANERECVCVSHF